MLSGNIAIIIIALLFLAFGIWEYRKMRKGIEK
jgi:uncharacterized membrane protein